MEDNEVTQVFDPVPPTASAEQAKARLPRRWFFAAVIAGLLLLAGVAVAIVMGGQDAKVAEENATVPDLRGMTLERAGDEVKAVGLAPGTVSFAVVDESVTPSGTVLSQDPLPGAVAQKGSTVNIVLAQGPQPPTVVAEAETEAPAEEQTEQPPGTDGNQSAEQPPAPESPLPDLPPAGSIDISKLQPRVVDPGIFKLVEPQYTTVLEHEAFSAADWQSPALTFGDKPKRIWITAAGPYNTPIAVWAWGPGDTDWKLKTIWASYPGAYENADGTGGTWIEPFKVGAGTYTVLVRLNPGVTWWKIRVEEQK